MRGGLTGRESESWTRLYTTECPAFKKKILPLSSSSQTLDRIENSESPFSLLISSFRHFRFVIALRIATDFLRVTVLTFGKNCIDIEFLLLTAKTMSTQGQEVMRYARNGRRRKGLLDLNVPPVENLEQAGGPVLSVDQGSQGNVPAIPVTRGGQVHQPAGSTLPAPIDVEEYDDDVIISSPRAFEEAKKKSRRTLVIDVDAEEVAISLGLNQANKRRRGLQNPPSINCELYVNLEGSSGSMRERAQYIAPPPPPPPPPKEPTFSCPVCMGPLVEEVTTKCGHIFCKACIMAAIKAQHKCPTFQGIWQTNMSDMSIYVKEMRGRRDICR
ncbi:hypothetical protein L1987_50653 [Smallanthus sonchifolius]|uniref:Uncharacterized protein n=1 Tax=Smallanthus sonchifolius TaxID=185202 RepID=A0ACB9EN73_9ASTR|nr:hypothetical protein L1987_50653 [Smallanthus sonchifolius]